MLHNGDEMACHDYVQQRMSYQSGACTRSEHYFDVDFVCYIYVVQKYNMHSTILSTTSVDHDHFLYIKHLKKHENI